MPIELAGAMSFYPIALEYLAFGHCGIITRAKNPLDGLFTPHSDEEAMKSTGTFRRLNRRASPEGWFPAIPTIVPVARMVSIQSIASGYRSTGSV